MAPELAARLDEPRDDRIELWPDMVPVVSLFLSMETQWRWTGAGMVGAFRTGIDYAAIPVVATAIAVEVTPDVLADLRVLEGEAVSTWARKAR